MFNFPLIYTARPPVFGPCKLLDFELEMVGTNYEFINWPSPWRPPVYKMNTVFRESKLA